MPLTDAQLDADLAAMIADLPVDVTANGETHTGTRSSLRRVDILAIEGLHQNYDFSVHLRAVDWNALPGVSSLVAIGGKTYIVVNLQDGNADRERRLDLGQRSFV